MERKMMKTIKVERFSEGVGNQLHRYKDPLSREQPLLWKPKEENERSGEKEIKFGGNV